MTDPDEEQLIDALMNVSLGPAPGPGSSSGSRNTNRMGLQDPTLISQPHLDFMSGVRDNSNSNNSEPWVPMKERVKTWTSSPSSIHPQENSILFALPSELRERIWFYALTQDVKPLPQRPPYKFNYRPDHEDDPREDEHRELLRYDVESPPSSRMSPEDLTPVDHDDNDDDSTASGGAAGGGDPRSATMRSLDRLQRRALRFGNGFPPLLQSLHSPYRPHLPAWNTQTYDWYRPDYEGLSHTPGLSILRACRKIYLEASHLVARARVYTFWYFRAQPGRESGLEHYFNTVIPVDQRREAKHARLFVQEYWLEQSFPRLMQRGGLQPPPWQVPPKTTMAVSSKGEDGGVDGEGMGKGKGKETSDPGKVKEEEETKTPASRLPNVKHPPLQPVRHQSDQGFFHHLRILRLTVRRGDWWHNETNTVPVINPFSGTAHLPHMARDMRDTLPSLFTSSSSTSPSPSTNTPSPLGDDGHLHAPAIKAYRIRPADDKSRAERYDGQQFSPASWGLAFRHLPNLETIIIDLEHSEDKRAELAVVAEWARRSWWFPAFPLVRMKKEGKSKNNSFDDWDVVDAATVPREDGEEIEKKPREFRPVLNPDQVRGFGVDPIWSWRGDVDQWSHQCTATNRRDCMYLRRGPGNTTTANTSCPGGWCQRKAKMLSIGLGPRMYGYSVVFRRVFID